MPWYRKLSGAVTVILLLVSAAAHDEVATSGQAVSRGRQARSPALVLRRRLQATTTLTASVPASTSAATRTLAASATEAASATSAASTSTETESEPETTATAGLVSSTMAANAVQLPPAPPIMPMVSVTAMMVQLTTTNDFYGVVAVDIMSFRTEFATDLATGLTIDPSRIEILLVSAGTMTIVGSAQIWSTVVTFEIMDLPALTDTSVTSAATAVSSLQAYVTSGGYSVWPATMQHYMKGATIATTSKRTVSITILRSEGQPYPYPPPATILKTFAAPYGCICMAIASQGIGSGCGMWLGLGYPWCPATALSSCPQLQHGSRSPQSHWFFCQNITALLNGKISGSSGSVLHSPCAILLGLLLLVSQRR